MTYTRPTLLSLKNHPELNEKWLQERIAEDPSILGLGDLVLKDKERIQPRAGRLDLLLQDPESNRRYEVELQLGRTDESHVIRTVEYWDIERKRYPQYDHTAVIVAEDITSRFLNVISLFNGFIPLVAIQLSALKVSDHLSLVFTTVLDEMPLGTEEEEAEAEEVTDRSYWEKRGTKATLAMTDKLLGLIHAFESGVELKYNKFYIGLAKGGQTQNFVIFRPQKQALKIELKLPRSDELSEELKRAGVEDFDYHPRVGSYRVRLTQSDLERERDFLQNLLERAHQNFTA